MPVETIPERIGSYKILGKVGEGGMGRVYKAIDEVKDEVIAIKVLPPEFLEDRRRSTYLRHEFSMALKLEHPNIITFIKLVERPIDDDPKKKQGFLLMEMIDGWTLRRHIRRQDLTLHQAIARCKEVLQGMAYIHQNGILHRDIKPENILISTTGELKIADFGLSTVHRTFSLGKERLRGTRRYMAPEQMMRQKVDARSDIYALGITFYELFTGKYPYENQGLKDIMNLRTKPLRPSKVKPGVPPQLDRIILKASAKRPQRRYQSVYEMQLDFNRLTQSTI